MKCCFEENFIVISKISRFYLTIETTAFHKAASQRLLEVRSLNL